MSKVKMTWNGPARLEYVGKKISAALATAGLHLQAASQKLVPVEFGVLKASAFTRRKGSGFDTQITVGYTAAYAIYVHEAVGMVLKGQPRKPSPPHQGRYWDPQGQAGPKFLERPAREERFEMLKLIRETAKI